LRRANPAQPRLFGATKDAPCQPLGTAPHSLPKGVSEYHRATGDASALKIALEGLERFATIVDDPSHVGDTHLPEPFDGSRCLGHAMILISLTRQLLEDPRTLPAGGDDRALVEKLNDRAVDEISLRFPDQRTGLVREVLQHDYTAVPPGPNADFVYLGHGIETLWMLMLEAVRRADRKLYDWAARQFMHHVDVARDPVYGGVFRGLDVATHTFLIDDDCKVKWAQDEVLVGCAILLRHGLPDVPDPDPNWALRTYKWIQTYMDSRFRKPLRDRGLPYVLVGGDRHATYKERYVNAGQMAAPSRKENYHHPRALMMAIELLSAAL